MGAWHQSKFAPSMKFQVQNKNSNSTRCLNQNVFIFAQQMRYIFCDSFVRCEAACLRECSPAMRKENMMCIQLFANLEPREKCSSKPRSRRGEDLISARCNTRDAGWHAVAASWTFVQVHHCRIDDRRAPTTCSGLHTLTLSAHQIQSYDFYLEFQTIVE